MVRQVVDQERISLLTLQETKLNAGNEALVGDMLGPSFDFFLLPASNTSGGILLAWKRDRWDVSTPIYRDNSLTAKA
ncbi:unnamed protein product [Urochloa humidicola]